MLFRSTNGETITITARSNYTLTITRGTPARNILVGDQIVSTFVTQAFQKLKSLPQVERAAWFLVQDEAPRNGAWYTTGLRKETGAKKPSFSAWASAAKKLHKSPIH